MKKHLFFLPILLTSLFFSCEKSDDTIDLSSSRMQIYGTEIPITHGVIWKSNQNTILEKVEYIWADTYVDELGDTKTDDVVGFFKSDKKVETGNFMLSLYGDGLNFIPELAATKGEGALICLHLSSSDLTKLTLGKYNFDKSKLANTFVGYLSTVYNMGGTFGNLVTIVDGVVNVSKDGDNYNVDLNAKLSNGLVTSCNFKGRLDNCAVSQPQMSKTQGVSIHGLVPVVTSRTWHDPNIFGPIPDLIETSLDYVNRAFFSIATGVTQTASENKTSVEIALKLDATTKEFTFISPIKARAVLGHLPENDFPCHTKFMRAPATFTASDYDNLEETGMTFTVAEEEVKFSIENFKPGYVFFDAGSGASGVINVKGIGKPFEIVTDMLFGMGWMLRYDTLTEQLICDIKSTTNYGNPKIR